MNVDELMNLGKEIFELKAKCEEIQAQLKTPQEKLDELKAKMLAHLEQLELDKIHVKGYGTINTITKMSVSIPQGDMRDEFFAHLSPEDYKALRTVNSASLNSWFNEKMQKAIDSGDLDFHVIGIQEPKAYKILGMRKG